MEIYNFIIYHTPKKLVQYHMRLGSNRKVNGSKRIVIVKLVRSPHWAVGISCCWVLEKVT